MKVIELKVENFKNLVAVDITPKSDVVIVSGSNAQGKTSVLDSIWAALDGKSIPKEPIRKGKDKAVIEMNIGPYLIKRIFTKKGNYLSVENAEGAKFQSPQKMLDRFLGELSFDPLEFTRLTSKEQQKLLLSIIKFKINSKELGVEVKTLDELNLIKKDTFEERTRVNRELLSQKNQLEAMKEVKEISKVSISELLKQKQELEETDKNQLLVKEDNAAIARNIYSIEQEIKEAKLRLKSLNTEKEQAIRKYKAEEEKIKAFPDFKPQITSINTLLIEADGRIEKAAEYQKKVTLEATAEQVQKRADALSNKLLLIENIKKEALSQTKMPIDNLEIEEDSLMFKGIPFSQVSLSEQLRVSLAIAISLNPQIRVIRICDGSLLDKENLKAIEKIAKANTMQIWIEKVDETGKIGFYIQEGKIISINK